MASIPVDLFNPGQVFACVGFLEAAEVLLGDAIGGFDWRYEEHVRFELSSRGERNPFDVVLGFLAEADICCRVPVGYANSLPVSKRRKGRKDDGESQEEDDSDLFDRVEAEDTFPGPKGDPMALPIRLVAPIDGRTRTLCIGHWADASSRNDFKLYAGNRSAATIARAMLRGTREKPKKGEMKGAVRTRGIDSLWNSREELVANPFDVLTPMGGSFNFDPRGAWIAIDAGYSPNDHKHVVSASPVVEILAAVGMEHARPDEYETRRVRYGAWGGLVPPILARAALGCARIGIPLRTFQFMLDLSGKNKVVTIAKEEISG
ncbi:MAG: type I-U CRISPR-associated protein Cas8c [Candidatus Binatus sp.]